MTRFKELLEKARNLEQTAITKIISQNYALVQGLIRKRVAYVDVDDAIQEFFYYILKINLFSKFKGQTEIELRVYLVRVAINFSFDWRKKSNFDSQNLDFFDANNESHWKILETNTSIIDNIIKEENTRKLNDAISQLEIQYKQVLELKLLDYSNSEIAEILQSPLGSINSWYTRGLQKLRDLLKNLNIDLG